MNEDVLVVDAAAVADLDQIAGADEGDALVAHARRRGADQQHVDLVRMPAGFFDKLAARGVFQRIVVVIVSDQTSRHFDGARAQRHPVLLDEQHLVLRRHRDDDHRHAAGMMAAFAGFPLADLHQPQPLSFIEHFAGFGHAVLDVDFCRAAFRPLFFHILRGISCGAAA